MKKLLVFALLPVLLFGLETVNLIKDSGFEFDNNMWSVKSVADGEYDSTEIKNHDPDSAYIGGYCASIDTRTKPAEFSDFYSEIGSVYQILLVPKKLEDLDSLEFYHMGLFIDGQRSWGSSYNVQLNCTRPSDGAYVEIYYSWGYPGGSTAPETSTRKIFRDTLAAEGVWYDANRDINEDLIVTKGLSSEIELDSLYLNCSGVYYDRWRGQKAFFDGIRLMGYADYDVGVKEILSPDTIGALGESLRNSPLYEYIPVARVKNFGREDAEEFNVIAEVWDDETLIYEETISHSLPGDTEDTLEFPPFTPTYMTTYTLTIRTEMVTPAIDECDEDDQLSKIIGTAGIADDPTLPSTTLDVTPITSTLSVSYTLPSGQSASLSVYDATGCRIKQMTVTGAGSVNIPELSSGVYFVRLDAGLRINLKKVVVAR